MNVEVKCPLTLRIACGSARPAFYSHHFFHRVKLANLPNKPSRQYNFLHGSMKTLPCMVQSLNLALAHTVKIQLNRVLKTNEVVLKCDSSFLPRPTECTARKSHCARKRKNSSLAVMDFE
jgi:hypothetical protein